MEVHYRLMWQGQQIISVQSDVLMGNVSIPESDELTAFPGNGNGYKKRRKEIVPSQEQFHMLSQFFSAEFIHLNKISENEKDSSSTDSLKLSNDDDNVVLKEKSGNPGYKKGMPLITASYELVENKIDKKVIHLKVSYSQNFG